MLDMGIHEFDSARFLMGSEVVDVQATARSSSIPRRSPAGDVDTAVVNLRFASGAIGSVELSRRIAFGEDVRTEVTGTDGSASIGSLPVEHGSGFARAGGIQWDATRPSTPRFAAAYRDQARAFARSIQADAPVSPSGIDGARRSSSPRPPSAPSSDGGRVGVDAEA
jgi:predicted dehydrogenase